MRLAWLVMGEPRDDVVVGLNLGGVEWVGLVAWISEEEISWRLDDKCSMQTKVVPSSSVSRVGACTNYVMHC